MNFLRYKEKTNVNMDMVASVSYKEDATRKEEVKIIFIIPGANIPIQWNFDSRLEGKMVYEYIIENYIKSLDEIIELDKKNKAEQNKNP